MRQIARSRFLSDAELDAFMRAVRERKHRNAARDHAFFAILANLGLRPSEVLALEAADVHVHAHPPWLRVTRKKKRTAVPDDIQITGELANIVARHVYASSPPRAGRVFPFGARAAQRLFHLYASRSCIFKPTILYILRHTAATRIYRLTKDIGLVQAMLGHESADTSALYAHLSRAVVAEAVSAIAPIV